MTDNQPNTFEEIWKAIPGFPGYDVSDQGRVRSYWRRVGLGPGMGFKSIIKDLPQRILKPSLIEGYPLVTMKQGDEKHGIGIHRLILLAFVGPCPPGFECRHLDGIRTHSVLGNLQWGTHSENMIDKFQHGYTLKGMNAANRKLTDIQVLEIRELHMHGHLRKNIAKVFGVSISTVGYIITRKRWAHI